MKSCFIPVYFFLCVALLYPTFNFADCGYYLDGAGNAAYWTEHSSQNIRIEVADSVYTESSVLLGTFGIGGNAASGYKVLTNNFHWPYQRSGQNFVLYVDGTYFTNKSAYSSELCGYSVPRVILDSTYFVGNDTSIATDGEIMLNSHWRIPLEIGNIDVYQELKPESIVVDDTLSVGIARIKYRVINNDVSVAHNIGLKLFLDLNVDGNDNPDISLDGDFVLYGVIRKGDEVPTNWRAYENIYSSTAVIALGLLRGMDCTPPDIFALGNSPFALSRYLWIETDCSDSIIWSAFEDSPTSDLAAVWQWEPTTLSYGEENTYITYYGFGSTVPSAISGRKTETDSPYFSAPAISDGNVKFSIFLPHSVNISLQLLDITGRKITTINDGYIDSGEHTFSFDASYLANGIYFARLIYGNDIITKRVLILR